LLTSTLLEVFRQDQVDSQDKSTFDLLARAKQSLAVPVDDMSSLDAEITRRVLHFATN
jgi:hypothetical protein